MAPGVQKAVISSEEIKISQLINPSKFYFYSLNNQKIKLVKEQEDELQKSLDGEENNGYHVEVGKVCAFFHDPSKKWIKVEVDEIKIQDHQKLAILWCTDYGVPLSTNKFHRFAPVPSELKTDLQTIECGCLKILPAKSYFDYAKGETVVKTSSEWSPKAVEICLNFIEHATKICFVIKESVQNTNFGDLEATNDKGVKFSLCKILMDRRLAFTLVDELFYKGIKNIDAFMVQRCNKQSNKQGETLDLMLPQCEALLSNFEDIAGIENESKFSVNAELSKEKNVNSLADIVTPLKKSEKIPPSSSKLNQDPPCNFQKIAEILDLNKITTNDEKNSENKENRSSNALTLETVPSSSKSEINNNECSSKSLVNKSSHGALEHVFSTINKNVSLMDVAKLFVHGKCFRKAFESIDDAIFFREIRDGLNRMKFRTIFRTQALSWPNIAEGTNVFIVNSENSGKTFSYLPPILNSVMAWEETPEQGPIGVIVVRSSREVEMLYKYCLQIVPRDKMEIVKAFGMWKSESKKVDLLNGCDLLITTPPCFSRLAEGKVIQTFSKNRIKHLIFDGIDSMHDVFEKEIKDIIKTCTWGEKHVEKNPQIVVTSTSWMEYIRRYMKLASNPMVIFGSFVEAAVYSKCQFTIVKYSHQEKLDKLYSYLKKNRSNPKKTLVVFNTQTELEHLKEFLSVKGIEFSLIDDKTSPDDIDETSRKWNQIISERISIMLVADEILTECNFTCVDVLIHFSLPTSWTRFSRRFATMNETFMNAVDDKTAEKPLTIVMLDDRNAKEIPRLIEFAENRKLLEVIPENIKDLIKLIVEEREALKRESGDEITQICLNVFQFGKCSNITNCNKRHVFTETDKPVNIPIDGLLKFELIGVQNPSQYFIKIFEHLPAGSKSWISCKEKNEKIQEALVQLQKMMAEVCVIQTCAKVNDICAVYCPKTVQWCRCKVLEKQNTDNPSKFKAIVYCMDYGRRMVVKSTDLKILPEPMKLLDPLLTQLRIVNLVPYDKDEIWDHETTAELTKYFSRKSNLGDYILAKVEFAVENTIFTETFEIRYRIEDLAVDVAKYSLKIDLLKKNYCLKDNAIADALKDLLKRAEIYVPDKTVVAVINEHSTNEDIIETHPKWKQLSVGSEYQVYLKHFENPDMFYVILDDANNMVLGQLMKQVESCKSRIRLEEVKEGRFCLAVLKDQKPKRALVTKIQDDGFLKIFLLDSGDSVICGVNEVYELPVALINAFPFQAAHCRLKGVKPRFNLPEWPQRGLKVIRKFISSFCGNSKLKMRVIKRDKNVFDVVLADLQSGKKLHKVLIKEKFADMNELDKEIEMNDEGNSDDDEQAAPEQERDFEAPTKAAQDLLNILKQSTSDFVPPPVKKPPNGGKSKNIKPLKKQVRPVEQILQVPSTLSHIHKPPKIEWRQNEVMIWLSISAIDCETYSLIVKDSSLKIHVKYRDSKYEYTSLQLFGVVMQEYVSHEKTGEKIIVRLLKNLSLPWSRLSLFDDPRFITFNNEDVPTIVTQEAEVSGRPAGDSDELSESGSDLSDKNDVVKDQNEPV